MRSTVRIDRSHHQSDEGVLHRHQPNGGASSSSVRRRKVLVSIGSLTKELPIAVSSAEESTYLHLQFDKEAPRRH